MCSAEQVGRGSCAAPTETRADLRTGDGAVFRRFHQVQDAPTCRGGSDARRRTARRRTPSSPNWTSCPRRRGRRDTRRRWWARTAAVRTVVFRERIGELPVNEAQKHGTRHACAEWCSTAVRWRRRCGRWRSTASSGTGGRRSTAARLPPTTWSTRGARRASAIPARSAAPTGGCSASLKDAHRRTLTPTPWDSPSWRRTYVRRSALERINSRLDGLPLGAPLRVRESEDEGAGGAGGGRDDGAGARPRPGVSTGCARW